MADGRVAENLILPDHPIFATLAWKSRTHRWSNRGGHSVWLQRLPRSLMDGARHLDLDRLGAASRVRTCAGRFEGAQDRAACDGPWRRRVHQLGVVLVRARIALRTAPPGATAPVSSPRRGDGPQDRLLAITQPSEVTDPAAMRARGTARCAPRCAPPARSAVSTCVEPRWWRWPRSLEYRMLISRRSALRRTARVPLRRTSGRRNLRPCFVSAGS